MKTLGDRLKDLTRAVRRLADNCGRTARGNARRAVFAELKRIRKQVDHLYPTISKPRLLKKRLLPRGTLGAYGVFVKRMRGKDYVEIADRGSGLLAYIRAGVPLRTYGEEIWAPRWVFVVGPHTTELRRVGRSRRLQRARIAEHALAARGEKQDASF